MNNREIATFVWLALALAAALFGHDVRKALWEVVKSFARPRVIGSILLLGAWVAGLLVLAHEVGLWETDERNDTIAWFITVGIAFFFSLRDIKQKAFFRKTARRAVGASVFVEGFVNLAVFGLAVELLIVPVITFLVALVAVSTTNSEYAPVGRLVNRLLSAIGVFFIGYSAVRLVGNFDPGYTVRAMALPVWLTFGVMPFIYIYGLVAEYEQAFMRIDLHASDPFRRRRAKRSLMRVANVRASELAGFTGHWIHDLASAESKADAREVMARWRRDWRAEERRWRLVNARSSMQELQTQSDAGIAEIHADVLRRGWERLDRQQRATLKAEAMALGGRASDEIAGLPD